MKKIYQNGKTTLFNCAINVILNRMIFISVALAIFFKTALAGHGGQEKNLAVLISTDNDPESIRVTDGAIQPNSKNPWYWEYKGKPILLRGASDEDNLFQWTGKQLIDHLDLLVSLGGNYLRNTMSDRDISNVYAFGQTGSNLYDLDRWNEEYWSRLTFFLDETSKRDIIVQLTLWDQFDLSTSHPWFNNINIKKETINNRATFYKTVETNSKEGLYYQGKFIDKLLSITLKYDHILYNINNESSEGAIWENYWAKYIHQSAEKAKRKVHVTSMQLNPGTSVRHVMTYAGIYSFAEVSQNNQDAMGPVGRKHWENLIFWRDLIASGKQGPMPVNNEKVYGQGVGNNTAAGTEKEAIERFWRNIFGGAASTRFHRPALRDNEDWGWGIGLSEPAQRTLRGVSMFLGEFDIFNATPHRAIETVGNSVDCYCLADIGKVYAVYFPSGRATVHLDPWVYVKKVSVKWLDVTNLTWSKEVIIEPKWDQYDGIPWWGPQRIITLAPANHRSNIAIIKVVE